MIHTDLVLLLQAGELRPYRVSPLLAEKLRSGSDVRLFGTTFKDRGSCCEWLEILDSRTDKPIGVALVDFYQPEEDETVTHLKSTKNVIWTKDYDATVLFCPTQHWKVNRGPYLPVSFFRGDAGQACYFVREGVSDNCSVEIPQVQENQ